MLSSAFGPLRTSLTATWRRAMSTTVLEARHNIFGVANYFKDSRRLGMKHLTRKFKGTKMVEYYPKELPSGDNVHMREPSLRAHLREQWLEMKARKRNWKTVKKGEGKRSK